VQRLAAGGEDRDVRALPQQRLRQARARAEEVLAVVEHEQHLALGEVARERRLGRVARVEVDAQRVGRGLADQAGVADARQFDRPRPVGVALRAACGQLEGEARLAAAPRAGERDKAAAVEQVVELVELAEAPDEARRLPRQVVSVAARRTRRFRGCGGSGRAFCEELAVELAREWLRVGGQGVGEGAPQRFVLRERLAAAAGRGVGAHEGAVGLLVERVGHDRAVKQVDRIGGVTRRGELQQQVDVAFGQ
jgi:hypothetical protein